MGVEYALQSPTIMKRVQDEFIVNHSRRLGEFTKEEREKGHLIIMSAKYNELLNSDKYNTKVKPLFSLKEYKGVYKDHNWLCLKCGEEFEDCLNNMKVPRCPTCNPRLAGRSVGEKEVFDFLADYIYCEDNKQWRFKLLMKIQQNQKKSVKITCFLTRNSVYLRSER